MTIHFDAIIVGRGFSALAVARQMLLSGKKVALIYDRTHQSFASVFNQGVVHSGALYYFVNSAHSVVDNIREAHVNFIGNNDAKKFVIADQSTYIYDPRCVDQFHFFLDNNSIQHKKTYIARNCGVDLAYTNCFDYSIDYISFLSTQLDLMIRLGLSVFSLDLSKTYIFNNIVFLGNREKISFSAMWVCLSNYSAKYIYRASRGVYGNAELKTNNSVNVSIVMLRGCPHKGGAVFMKSENIPKINIGPIIQNNTQLLSFCSEEMDAKFSENTDVSEVSQFLRTHFSAAFDLLGYKGLDDLDHSLAHKRVKKFNSVSDDRRDIIADCVAPNIYIFSLGKMTNYFSHRSIENILSCHL